MPDPAVPQSAAEPCPACSVLMDVSALQPFSKVVCAACGATVRVRTAFHHFQIVREVGLGGMSRVFGARDASLGRDLALKILNPGLSQDDKRLRQFEREAQITASISHPNVVKVYTAGRDQGYFYIAMELVEGGSLDEKIQKQGRLPEAWVLEVAEQVVQGLKAANEAGLIHRDIKPGNILLSAEGTPKIVDFGLAVFTRDGVDDTEIWATPYYVPPETLYGEPEDFRSDIYALGSTLYHAMMGKPLFDSDSNSLAKLKALKAKLADLKEAGTVLSAETVAMLTRTLRRKPADRYSSYDEFLDHLRYARRRLKRGGRGAAWPGQQGLTPAQWGGLAAAVVLAGAGLWKWSSLSSDREAGKNGGGLLADTDPTVGGDSTVSSKFIAARETLWAGNFASARQQFKALASDHAIRQPTLNWARYNAGLAALFAADVAAARTEFAAIRAAGTYSNDAADLPAATFFLRSAAVGENDEPVAPAHTSDCPPDTAQAIGLLSAGLKNWHLGDLSGAATFLRAFESSNPPRSAAWVDRYKKLAQPYLDEVKIIDALPALPLGDITPEAATAQLTRARGLVAGLTLPGAARDAAGRRLEDIAAAIDRMTAARNAAEAAAMESKTTEELAELSRMEADLASLGAKLAFGEAAARLRQFKPSSTRGKEMLADHLRWWENADSFLDVLANDLATPIEGTLDRPQGPSLRGLIGGTAEGLKVKPPSGPEVTLPFSNWTPASLAALAERVLERAADSDEYYRRRELLVAFALRSGLKTYGVVAGRELAREHPGFRTRWALQEP